MIDAQQGRHTENGITWEMHSDGSVRVKRYNKDLERACASLKRNGHADIVATVPLPRKVRI